MVARPGTRKQAIRCRRFVECPAPEAARDRRQISDGSVKWFLEGKQDVRSSYYLEDVATEFHVQGLELDWACVTWDADFRFSNQGWSTHSFVGDRWQRVNKAERKQYLKNAYRVLLTRARQGMIIVVPNGNGLDHTRKCKYYDETFDYLAGMGLDLV